LLVAAGGLLPLLVAGIAEWNLRRDGFQFEPWRYYRRFGANFEAEEIESYAKDPDLFWRFRPSQTLRTWWVEEATINRYGFRGEDFPEKKEPGVLRVLCAGDSGTFGWGVRDNESFSVYLQEFLGRRWGEGKVQVVNAGVPGYSSHQGLHVLKKWGPRLRPDIVIFSFGRNDHNPTAWLTDRQRKKIPRPLVELQNVLLRTRLYQWFYMRTTLYMYIEHREKFLGSRRETVRVTLSEYEENLRRAAALCRDGGADIVFVPRSQQMAYIDVMKRVAKETGSRYVDLEKFSSDRGIKDYSLGEHPGWPAYKRLAEIVGEEVARLKTP